MYETVFAKKPGPRPSDCPFCNSNDCSHCRCSGFEKCDHMVGELCKRSRYKRRLVCNPCEKHKLRNCPKKDNKSNSKLNENIIRQVSRTGVKQELLNSSDLIYLQEKDNPDPYKSIPLDRNSSTISSIRDYLRHKFPSETELVYSVFLDPDLNPILPSQENQILAWNAGTNSLIRHHTFATNIVARILYYIPQSKMFKRERPASVVPDNQNKKLKVSSVYLP